MPANVNIIGGARLRRTLKSAGADMADLKEANARVGAFIAAEANPIAPRGATGKLAGSVRTAKQAARARVLAGSKAVPYAGVIHFGWPAHHIKAQPWISTAAVASEPQWVDMYLTDVQKLCDSVQGA